MRLKRETQGAFCVLNANAKSQTRKSMKINVICTVGVQVLGATGQQVVTAVPWIPPLRIANWSPSCVMALPGLQECPARSPDKWQPEMGLDPISLGLKPTLAFGTWTWARMFAQELPGVSLGLTTNRRGTCAILPDGDGHMLVPVWLFW